MAFRIRGKKLLSPFILLTDDSLHLNVYQFGSLLAIRLGEAPFLSRGVIVIQVRKTFAHAKVNYHCVGLFGHTLQVVGCTG